MRNPGGGGVFTVHWVTTCRVNPAISTYCRSGRPEWTWKTAVILCFSVSRLVAQRWAKQRPGFLGSMRKFHLMTVFVASGFALSACSFSTDALWPALRILNERVGLPDFDGEISEDAVVDTKHPIFSIFV